MGLTCECYHESEPGQVIWTAISDYKPLDSKRACRCCSCGEKIRPGELCAETKRYKVPETEVECRIYGEDGEVPRASRYMCERCADIANSLEGLGFCAQPWEDQRELLRDYVLLYGPDKVHWRAL